MPIARAISTKGRQPKSLLHPLLRLNRGGGGGGGPNLRHGRRL